MPTKDDKRRNRNNAIANGAVWLFVFVAVFVVVLAITNDMNMALGLIFGLFGPIAFLVWVHFRIKT